MIPLIGYSDELSARPGESLGFKVSSTLTAPYDVQLVRIICADPNPDGPGIQHEEVDAACNGTYPSRFQDFVPGSYAEAPLREGTKITALRIAARILPTLRDRVCQTVLSFSDPVADFQISVVLGPNGLSLRLNHGALETSIETRTPIKTNKWTRFTVAFDLETGAVELAWNTVGRGGVDGPVSVIHGDLPAVRSLVMSDQSYVRIGAGGDRNRAREHFNGRIEAPAIYTGDVTHQTHDSSTEAVRCLVAWDFSLGIDTDQIFDTGPDALHGKLVNMPNRAVAGSNWTGREMSWRHAPEEYAAIHFHEDDCHDCGWADDFIFDIPPGFRRGNYAMRLRCGAHEDFVPFFVAAPLGTAKSKICVVIPTFTYVMYGNNGRYDFGPAIEKRMAEWGAYPYNPAKEGQFCQSSYNLHPDGSGISLCSWRRPLLNLRSGYLTLLAPGCGSGLRHYQADSHLWAWLDRKGFDFDVVTDHQLHRDGAEALSPYRVVLTCTHPEYHTEGSLDAFQNYVDGGGRLCYLGGNGFYWKIAVSDKVPGIAEVRRAEGGIRTWAAAPGEYYNALDGQYGGLWRRNGRPPQELAGVGFSAQGTFLGSYYRRTEASERPEFAWIFEGINEETLGHTGFSGSGAAGYELDRLDLELGSPENAVVLARSEAHADSYIATPEEILTHVSTVTGLAPSELVHADMVFFDTPEGGAVFSVGSITFCGSLPVDDFNNPVSRLLENVVSGFLAQRTGLHRA